MVLFEPVPHVQDRGDVRRRDHDHVRIAPILEHRGGGDVEPATLQPFPVQGRLYRAGVQSGRKIPAHVAHPDSALQTRFTTALTPGSAANTSYEGSDVELFPAAAH